MTLSNCPKKDPYCKHYLSHYSLQTDVSGVLEGTNHVTLVLFRNVELNFLIPVLEKNHESYSLLRIPFKQNLILTTVVSILAIFTINLAILTKNYGLLSSLTLTVGFLIRSTVSQSLTQISHDSKSIRLLCLIWLFCCIVLTELYRGHSIGNFVIPNEPKRIDSFKELAESKIKCTQLLLIRETLKVLRFQLSSLYYAQSRTGNDSKTRV